MEVNKIWNDLTQADLDAATTALKMGTFHDPRKAVREILNKLVESAKGETFATYSASKASRNLNLETQRETYVFNIDMSISLIDVQPESLPMSVVPTQPVAVPTQPVAAPTQPVAAPTQPVAAPTQPVAAPTQPVAAPTQPVAHTQP